MKRVILVLSFAGLALTLPVGCNKKPAPTVDQPVRVETAVVTSTDITGSRNYSGTVEESSGTALSFSVPGTIQSVYVSAGDRVGAGQTIATLDAASLKNAYEIAKATTASAQDAYDRMKMLHDSGSLPDMKWVEVENALKQAQSAEAIALKTLSDARITAPFAGYVAEKFVDAGTTVAPGIPVVKVVKINPVKVNLSIPENDISKFAAGQKCQITVGALGGREYTGTLTEKAVAANPLTRAYDVKFTVDNPDGALLPGMVCDANLVSADADAAASAIVLATPVVLLDADNQNFVWLDSAGYAVKRIVAVGGLTDTGIIISSGIAEGDSVIVAGQQKVSSMMRVVPVDK